MSVAKRSFVDGRSAQSEALSRTARQAHNPAKSHTAIVIAMAAHLIRGGPAAIATEAAAVRALYGHFAYRDITHLCDDARLAALRFMVKKAAPCRS